MTQSVIVFLIVFALSIIAYDQDAFGILGCDVPHCYALQQTSRSTAIDGIECQLDSPDLWVDRTACKNVAVSAGWLTSTSTGEWVESGLTKGDVKNVGCVTKLSTYYAFNNVASNQNVYSEYLVPNGRVDPGNDIKVRIQKYGTSQVQVFVTTPDVSSPFAVAQVGMNPKNVYYGDFGIEGTVSASDEYSSIPMSKFTGMKIKQGSTLAP